MDLNKACPAILNLNNGTFMKKKHILVVDDEPEVLELIELCLKKRGFEISLASDGYEALDLILENNRWEHPVDLLITDINMPRMPGTQLIGSLQNMGFKIPIIILSGCSRTKTNPKFKDIKFISKPFKMSCFVDAVNEVFESNQNF